MELGDRKQGAGEDDGEPSVRLPMPEQLHGDGEDGHPNLAERSDSTVVFDPRQERSAHVRVVDGGDNYDDPTGGGGGGWWSSSSQLGHAPEKKLTLFALRLAILEKAPSGLGALGFTWATVVLLGGFAITLDKTKF